MASSIQDLIQTVARLRAPDGCPWDQEQTHESLCIPLIDEVSELLDTIDRKDREHMKEELGDVLLQVVFHAQLAAEDSDFDFNDVAAGVNEKLIRRHPHVFGDMELKDTAAVLKQWEAIKAEEKKNGQSGGQSSGFFKPVPPRVPALLYAHERYKQIRKKQLDLDPELLDPNGLEEVAEDLSEEEAGAMLFQLAAACQIQGIDPESALRRYTSQLSQEIEDAFGSRQTV
ncbi:MAG: MazG family protein [Opitutales bacterium]|nr:MazG family protein [Opitutales bacterium]